MRKVKRGNKSKILKIKEILQSTDGSVKYIFRTLDKRLIESIYFPFSGLLDREQINASVLCLSSQIGCPMGCDFCATGKIKNSRNLSLNEIKQQYYLVKKDLKEKGLIPVDSLAMMGMGEPLLNFDNVVSFYLITKKKNEIKRFSISTVGITPKIVKIRNLNLDIKLYLSVHTAFNKERSKLIPNSSIYPVKQVVKESALFAKKIKRPVVANYILIKGINDSKRHAIGLAKLLDPKYFDIQLNLWNQISDSQFIQSDFSNLIMFKEVLNKSGYIVDIQLSKGIDVSGGCGQFSGKMNNKYKNET